MLRLCICPKCGRKHTPRTKRCPCGYIFSDNDPIYFFDDTAFEENPPPVSSTQLNPAPKSEPKRRTAPSFDKVGYQLAIFVLAGLLIVSTLSLGSARRDLDDLQSEIEILEEEISNSYGLGYDTEISDSRHIQDPVYITRSGAKFHKSWCPYLTESKTPISRDEAEADGYTACSRCHP